MLLIFCDFPCFHHDLFVIVLLILCNCFGNVTARESLNNREGNTDRTPVDKYHFIAKGVRCYPKFQLYRAFIESPYI